MNTNKIARGFTITIIPLIITFFALIGCEPSYEFNPELALNNDSVFLPDTAITTRILVFSNTSWKVEKEDTTMHWITLTTDSLEMTSGSGNGSFLVNVTANEESALRMMTLVISTKNKLHRLTFKQKKSN